jgi:hypothetical protein
MTPEKLLRMINSQPEHWKQDCKSRLDLDTGYHKAELVKDVVAIANSPGDEPGYIFYGVDLSAAEPIVGLHRSYDDATLQQIVSGKLERPVSFLYYEVPVGEAQVGVIAIPPSRRRPHILRVTYEHLREGQIPIRRGSSTTWAGYEDLQEMTLGASTDASQDLRDLILAAGQDSVRASTLALRAWDYAKRFGDTEAEEWLRHEFTGLSEGEVEEDAIPTYRKAKSYVTTAPLNPYALLQGSLETIAATKSGDFQETTVRLGDSITQLEEMVAMTERRKGVLCRQKRVPAADGSEVNAWFYFEPDSIRLIVGRIRDRISRWLMNLSADGPA